MSGNDGFIVAGRVQIPVVLTKKPSGMTRGFFISGVYGDESLSHRAILLPVQRLPDIENDLARFFVE